MKKATLWTVSTIAVYLATAPILHFLVFPEPVPAEHDRPRSGTVAELPDGSTFRFQVTGVESAGELMQAQWVGQPGAGIAPHTHPSQEVRFRVVAGYRSYYPPAP